MAATQVLVARSSSNGNTVGVCVGSFCPHSSVMWLTCSKDFGMGVDCSRVSWCPNYVVHNHCPEAYDVSNWFAL